MKRIAVYGKGGIGKSTISSNLTAALSDKGVRVMQIGCDPKHDSTRLLTDGADQQTVLEYLKDVPESNRRLDDIVEKGYKGCLCVEAGGPEPGIGCAGRGIISAFELLDDLGISSVPLDVVVYDVLGDVVCGGFAVPLRNNYADTVYIVTSGEFMSIYAANNILRGTANYNPDRIGGIIFNSRGDEEEKERVKRFSEAVNIPVVAEFSRSKEFLEAEQIGKTVVEAFPDSNITRTFRKLADTVMKGKKHTARYLSETELESVVLGRSLPEKQISKTMIKDVTPVAKKRYSSRNVHRNEILHGCAFSGASSVTLAVDNLATVLHSPRSCAQFAFQIAANSVRRSCISNKIPMGSFVDPVIHCTDMDEAVMIFGGIDSLEKSVRSLIAQGSRYIAVITSCPSGIIGEDVDGMIDRVTADHPNVTLIPMIEDGNVKGDFMQGVIDASLGLIRTVAVKDVKKTRSVNVVGMKTLATNCISNIQIVENILERMNVKLNCSCIGNTDIENIKNIAAAELSILMSPDRFAFMLKDFMKDEYELEFTNSIIRPGLEETRLWVNEIGKHFGETDAANAVIEDMKAEFGSRINDLKDDLQGRSIYIVGAHKDINWIMETATACNMNVMRCIVIDLNDHFKDYDLEIGYPVEFMRYDDLTAIKEDIAKRRPELLLTTYPMDVDIEIEQCFIPITTDVGPFSGPDQAETWARKLKAPKTEGWRKDVVRSR